MKSLVFEGKTWEVYETLRQQDKEQHKQLCKIIKEMMRNDPRVGIGKPEPLKHNLTGYWSRHLSKKDRVIYQNERKTPPFRAGMDSSGGDSRLLLKIINEGFAVAQYI